LLNAQELKSKINNDDILKLLNFMNADVQSEDEDVIITNTICHHGNKHKLYYYKDSKFFKCYTDCGDTFDIIELVCRNREYSFTEAMNWICIKLGFTTTVTGFGESHERIKDWEFINNLRNKKQRKNKQRHHDFYDRSILNIFQKMYLKKWIDEGISIESMLKYNISYSTLQQKVIIPHFNIHNQLMGVRNRITDEEEVKIYGKYAPFQINNNMYSHPIGQNLYGININKEVISQKKKIMLVEGEKSVLQCDTMFGKDNFTVALCGSSLSEFQKELIVSLGVNEVIIALDKQFENLESEEAERWAKHIREKIINKLAPYCIVTVLWDVDGLLPYKSSPTDFGLEILLKLMDKKIYTGYSTI
jgi:hypothetical protein